MKDRAHIGIEIPAAIVAPFRKDIRGEKALRAVCVLREALQLRFDAAADHIATQIITQAYANRAIRSAWRRSAGVRVSISLLPALQRPRVPA